jgi:hypothetical protein
VDERLRRFGLKSWKDLVWLFTYVGGVIASVFLFLWTQVRYPLLDGNDPIYLWTIIPSMVGVSGILWIARKPLFRGGIREPWLLRMVILAVAIPVTFAILGSLLLINGAFDRGPTMRRAAVVIARYDEPGNRHYMLRLLGDERVKPIKLALGVREPLLAHPGEEVLLEVRPGYLRRPWLQQHTP